MPLKKICECKNFVVVAKRRETITAALKDHEAYMQDPEHHRPMEAKNA